MLANVCGLEVPSEDVQFSPFQPLPSRPDLTPGQHLRPPCCLPWGLAKLVWPMAMPREDGDGVGPKGEGALRAPLGEPEAWMFPAHTHTYTYQMARQTLRLTSSPYIHTHAHTLTRTHMLKQGGRAAVSGWRAEMEEWKEQD